MDGNWTLVPDHGSCYGRHIMITLNSIRKDDDPRLAGALVCMVTAEVGSISASPDILAGELAALAAKRAAADFPPADIKDAVRGMLRSGGFKPAGRQKPASEYLAQAAREGRFPSINGPVDCNNLLSLETGLPISLLDADEFGGGAIVRICSAGEAYVFNASAQEMDLSGLLCVCAADGTPLGNPVKDSMRGKLKDGTRRLAGFIYAPLGLYSPASLAALGERFAGMLRDHCGATDARVVTVS
jgi:DNA/RNA-binding domain of Phe-tRNA-synthetase-like protein